MIVHLDIKSCVSVTPHITNHEYVSRPLDIKPCVSVTPHINNHDYMETEIEKENYTFMNGFCTKISVQSKITRTLSKKKWYSA
jgi:hypothetical protein